MVNTEIWMGSGGSITLCPETDIFTGFLPGSGLVTTVESGYEGLYAIKMTGTHTASNTTASDEFSYTYLMVNDIYAGCIADFYNSSNAIQASHVIARNSETSLYFDADYSTVPGTNGYIIIRSYGAPIPAPKISGDPALCSDNWLGLVNTVSFPTSEIEMKRMNLSLGGSRNFTHQYKGTETASGGNLDINANHGAWLYYALGKCTAISATVTPESALNQFESTRAGHFFIDNGSFASQGPMFYRKLGNNFCPPLLPTDAPANIDTLTNPSDSSDDIANGITYTLGEANGNELPSFALEYTLAKSDASPALIIEDATGDEVFTRIATGNTVNTLTLTANENEELKMTVDVNTKTIVEPQTGYYSRRNVTNERDFINFGSVQGGAANSVNHFLTPFFFSDGTISFLGQSYIRITSMSLTINNTLTDKRFVGQYNKRVKNAIPAQREYELTFSGHITDKALWDALRNETEEGTNLITLTFLKENGEKILLKFDDYFVTANTWPVVEDKGPLQIDWTIQPRTLNECTLITHWALQG